MDLNICQYCSKEFKKLSSLSVHLCEKKRRWQQGHETGVRFGFTAYKRFFDLTQGNKKNIDYSEFVDSPFYSAFVKFGQYLVSIQAVNPALFIDYVIKGNKKLDTWTKEVYYDEYLLGYLRTEHPQDAMERALKTMEEWAIANNRVFNHFFDGNVNRICQLINNGRISPWILFNCKSGVTFLMTLNQQQLELVYSIIDPDYWDRKFTTVIEDVAWVKEVLATAEL